MPKSQGVYTIYRLQKIVKKEDLLNLNFKKDGEIQFLAKEIAKRKGWEKIKLLRKFGGLQ